MRRRSCHRTPAAPGPASPAGRGAAARSGQGAGGSARGHRPHQLRDPADARPVVHDSMMLTDKPRDNGVRVSGSAQDFLRPCRSGHDGQVEGVFARREGGWAGATRGLGAPPGPRRLLRLGRAARQAVAAGPAGRRRRGGSARGRGHRLVRGPRLRRPLGDAVARGPAPLPERRVPGPALRRLPHRQRAGDGAAAGPVAAGRAAVAGRGLRRPAGRAGTGRPGAGRAPRAGPAAEGRRARGDRGPHRLGGGRLVEVPGQDRERAGEARRSLRHRARHRGRPHRPDAGRRDLRRGPGDARAARPDRRPDGRRPAWGRAGPTPRR